MKRPDRPAGSLEGVDLRYRRFPAWAFMLVIGVFVVIGTIAKSPGRDSILFMLAWYGFLALIAGLLRYRMLTLFRVEYPFLICRQGSRETKRVNLQELERARTMMDQSFSTFLVIKGRNRVTLTVHDDLDRFPELVALVKSHISMG
ncbi:MAG: hypothetical protein ABL962_04940 [Fimbriimonadaceae bacterium]